MALSRKIWSRVALAVSSGAAVGFAATSALRTYTAQTTEKDLLWAEETSSLPETLKKYATRAPIVLEPSSVYGWGHALNLFGLGPKQITTPTKISIPGKVHSVALGPDGAAYIDSDGKLFNVKTSAQESASFQPEPIAPDVKFTQVALGNNGLLIALAKNGYVYYRSSYNEQIQRMDSGDIRRKSVTKIAAGSDHAAALCSDGTAWAFGSNRLGQAGQPYSEKTPVLPLPTQIKFENDKFIDISCGKSHTVAVTNSGRVVSMGLNRFCQTGHPHTYADSSNVSPTPPPYMVFGESRQTMQQNVAHRKAFLESLRTDDPTTLSVYLPKPVRFFDDNKVKATKVVCGDDFTVVLGADGKLYNFGRGDMFALGSGRSKHINMPKPLEKEPFISLDKENQLKELSCGSNHCLALMNSGDLWSWGWNAGSGSTGLGHLQIVKTPAKVLNNKTVSSIQCNGDSSVVITK